MKTGRSVGARVNLTTPVRSATESADGSCESGGEVQRFVSAAVQLGQWRLPASAIRSARVHAPGRGKRTDEDGRLHPD